MEYISFHTYFQKTQVDHKALSHTHTQLITCDASSLALQCIPFSPAGLLYSASQRLIVEASLKMLFHVLCVSLTWLGSETSSSNSKVVL